MKKNKKKTQVRRKKTTKKQSRAKAKKRTAKRKKPISRPKAKKMKKVYKKRKKTVRAKKAKRPASKRRQVKRRTKKMASIKLIKDQRYLKNKEILKQLRNQVIGEQISDQKEIVHLKSLIRRGLKKAA